MSSPPAIPYPYPGIRPFEEKDAPIFFGREAQIDDLISKLETCRFVAVVGSSGSGKSSMVKAGLLPTLKLGLLREIDAWHSLVLRAGSHPFRSLAEQILRCHLHLEGQQALDREQALQVEGIAVELRKCPGGLAEVLQQFEWPPAVHFVLVVDQFEEIFAFRSPGNTQPAVSRDDAERIVQLLLQAASAPVIPSAFVAQEAQDRDLGRRVWTVITMRSDFIGQCEVFPLLAAAVSNSQFLVPVLDEHQKAEAIRCPGTRLNGAAYPTFEVDSALVRMMINDSGDQMDQLPLMQHALMRTWARASQRWSTAQGKEGTKRIILQKDYVPLNQALDQHAEDAWEKIKTQQPHLETLTKQLFLSLCDCSLDGAIIRRRPTVASVTAATGASMADLETVMRRFQEDERNFILPSLTDDPGHCLLETDVLDISHEALLRQWKTYGIWQEEERKDVAELRDLSRRSQLFKKDSGRVLSREDLDSFKKWKSGKTEDWALRYVTPQEWQEAGDLFAASERKLWLATQSMRALAGLMVVFAIGALLAVLLATGWAVLKKREVQKTEKEITNRITVSLRRLVGSSEFSTEISASESEALWDISELSEDNELVRKALLDYWFSETQEFSQGAKLAGDGIGTSIGLSLKLRAYANKQARILADKIVSQGSSGFMAGDSELEQNWQFLGQFLEPPAQSELLTALADKVEKDTGTATAAIDLSMVMKLIAARPGEESAPVVADLVRAAELLIKELAKSSLEANEGDTFADALAKTAAKLDAASAAKLAAHLVEVWKDPLMTMDAGHYHNLATALAGLLEKAKTEAPASLAQQGVAHLISEIGFLASEESSAESPHGFNDSNILLRGLISLAPKLTAPDAVALAELMVKELEAPQRTDLSQRDILADALTILMAKRDVAGPLVQRGAKQLIGMLETSQTADVYAQTRRAEMLTGLIAKLDAPAAAPLAQRGAEALIKVLKNSQDIEARPQAKLVAALTSLMAQLDAATIASLTKQLMDDSLIRSPLPPAIFARLHTTISAKLDAATAAQLRQRVAEEAVQELENPEMKDLESRTRLAQSLGGLVEKLPALVATPLAERGAHQLLQTLNTKAPSGRQTSFGYDFSSPYHLAQALDGLTKKLAASTTARMTEELVQALEKTPLEDIEQVRGLSRALTGLATNLPPTQGQDLRRRLLSELLSKLLNEPKEKVREDFAQQLALTFCESASVLPLREKQQMLLYALRSLINAEVPEFDSKDGLVIEKEERRIIREACATLDVAALANMLKWPQCRGEARKLVLAALEQKTGERFDEDIWKFVKAAAIHCYPRVELDGPAYRVSLKDMLETVSKPLNLSAHDARSRPAPALSPSKP